MLGSAMKDSHFGVSVFLVPPGSQALAEKPFNHDHLLSDYRIVEKSAQLNNGPHRRVYDPGQADVILFVGSRDPRNRDVRRHPLALQFPKKVILYSSGDWIIPYMRGIYPGLPRGRSNLRRTRSGHYIRWSDKTSINFSDPWQTPTMLFGFSGDSGSHPLRKRLFQLTHQRALMRDTRLDPARGFGQEAAIYANYRKRYAHELSAVRFVLCPRGRAPNSMRIFEAMKAGRVPVVIADEWVPAPGPSWESFMLRIPEKNLRDLPGILERQEDVAPEMGLAARRAWEDWFAPEVSFQVLASSAADLIAARWGWERFERLMLRRHLISPALRKITRPIQLQP
jgi:Exostosin family